MNTDQASGSSWEPAVDPVVGAVSGSRHDSGSESESSVQRDAAEFRIERPGTPMQRLRLTGHRYTLGSGEGCSIRLHDPGLQPMHAVMIRENGQLVVRAHSVPIEINDVRVTEAELHPGDVLRLGGYRFELLRHGNPSAEVSRISAELDHVGTSLDALKELPTQATQGGLSESEIADREQAWQEREQACQQREQICDQREASLRDTEAELQTRSDELAQREAELQAEQSATADLHEELAKRQQEISDLRETQQQLQSQFAQREAEFQSQESDAQQRLDEACRQLKQAEQEADEASRSVEAMREQFELLQHQLEELSQQQTELEMREQQQRGEHEKLVAQLQEARDQAIADQTTSDSQRREAELKLRELETLIDSLEKDNAAELDEHQAKLADSERSADALRQQVQELQQALNDACEESERLQAEQRESLTKISDLESTAAQASQQTAQDRQELEAEIQELRSTVDRLSTDLNKAIGELSELRDANVELTTQLADMQHKRDQALSENDSRPTTEAYQSLQEELALVNEQLDQVQHDYGVLLDQVDSMQHEQAPATEIADEDFSTDAADHSFANKLIRDLDNEAAVEHRNAFSESLPEEMTSDSPVSEATSFPWDLERSEEAYETEWSNTTEGDRIEGIQATDREELDGTGSDNDEPSLIGDQPAFDQPSREEDAEQRLDDSLSHQGPQESTENPADEDEDSIEAYMNRLLRRVQGKPLDEVPAPVESKSEPSQPKPQPQAKSPKKEQSIANGLQPDEPLRPRSQAPERIMSLSAMRELANSSAKNALSRSLRVQTRDTQIKGAISFACAGGAVICGLACYLLLPGQLRFVAVAMTSLVTLIYAREGVQLFREASRRLRAASLGKIDVDDELDGSSDEN